MPCWSRETSTIEFGPKTDPKMLGAAFRELGIQVQFSKDVKSFTFYSEARQVSGRFEGGKLTITSAGNVDQNEFKRAYSAQIVKSAAQRFGWQVKQVDDDKYAVQRRV